MKNWRNTSLLTTAILVVIIVVILYFFNISISVPSADIGFSPGNDTHEESPEYHGEQPKNIIVFIADGMGFGHLSLAMLSQQSENSPSVWQDFDIRGWHDTRSVYGPLTDSEASATAMATGTSTQFGHIGLDKDGALLQNIFELASDKQYNTGIVTDSYVWDGTPAGFSVHTRNEDDAREILNQIVSSKIDLIFGELEDVGEDNVPEKEESLDILSKRFMLLDKSLTLPGGENASKPIAAIFDEDEIQDLDSSPNLTKLTETALEYMSSQDQPFILMVECEEMDAASHENDSKRVINGLRSIQRTLSLVLNFAKADKETLVLFTADHETGGLAAVADFDNYPEMQIMWSTKDHTAAVVPLFAKGPGAEYFADIQRNREIGSRLKKLIVSDNSSNE